MPGLMLTILGAGPAAPNPGSACSGYLLRQDQTAVLLDCGSGVAGRLAPQLPPEQLRAVVISHLHPDHYFDLVPLYYLLRFGPPRPAQLGPRVPLWVPPGGRAFLDRLGALIADRQAMLEDVFEVCEYPSGGQVQLDQLRLSFQPVQHYVPSHAVRVQAPAGETFVFSSDVGPCPGLIEAARGADLFLCESSLLSTDDDPDQQRRGHMTAAEAGAAAHAAGARRLLLTHFRSSPSADQHHQQAASAAFGKPVELAREGQTYSVV